MQQNHQSTSEPASGVSTAPALEARGLFKVFGRRPEEVVKRLRSGSDRGTLTALGTAAVIDTSFEVRRGEIFVVMGLSGSGKSTLIRMLNGLQEPTDGEVLIDGTSITGVSEAELRRVRRSSISMVFQHFALLPHRTVLDNVAYPLEIQGVPAAERRERALVAVERAGLAGWHEKMPDELSGGMRQRVGLARALAADTDIVLMDEAFSALDPLIRREMQEQLIELQHELGKTIVFITHDLNEAMFLGDRIAVMRDGRIVQIGTPEEILTDPANDYVAQFVQDVDRARVLTAAAVMEPARSVVTLAAGPRAALRGMRDLQTSAAFVVGSGRRLIGTVRDRDVIEQVRRSEVDLSAVVVSDVVTVSPDTALSEIIEPAVESALPVAVVDADGRLLGAIPRVTLLAALGNITSHTGEQPVIEPPATVSTEIVTATLHATGGPVDDAVLVTEGGVR
ncbi:MULTISPECIES: quaternary amine ABC transporter ATP-binding protein [unclassified Rathayibacter]|uniref:quaternary amine ABC transporter ATP-binding protein n=1 Tax=unclassified Rathayibacter TaxID=2609250 RepID=UPI0007014E60|nr:MULTISPECIES: glycine betaine/L-proline ABC transporter ATP-binding protein [unclassified Rathayibacter]KQQ03880.1 glycine betaine ABC transporter ATP-binding protein [Rathayibacter sp. Leaf294]KQS12703.1 glycine betaine ABC transporter ATP-binding protein [Rathayibacter sp. Leaf185]